MILLNDHRVIDGVWFFYLRAASDSGPLQYHSSAVQSIAHAALSDKVPALVSLDKALEP
jgi:hypothetical protein